MAEWPWLMWWEFYILLCHCPYVLHISIKWHTCLYTWATCIPNHNAQQAKVVWEKVCPSRCTRRCHMPRDAEEMQLLEKWSAECIQLFGTFLAYYVELNWGTKENAELLTFLREMPRESWRWLDKAGWDSAQDWLHWKGVHERELHVYTLAPAVKWKNYKNNFFKKARMCYD